MGKGSHVVPKDSGREPTEGWAKRESTDRNTCRLIRVKGDQGEAWRVFQRKSVLWLPNQRVKLTPSRSTLHPTELHCKQHLTEPAKDCKSVWRSCWDLIQQEAAWDVTGRGKFSLFLFVMYSSDGKSLKKKWEKNDWKGQKIELFTVTMLLRGVYKGQELRILGQENSQGLKIASGLSKVQRPVRVGPLREGSNQCPENWAMFRESFLGFSELSSLTQNKKIEKKMGDRSGRGLSGWSACHPSLRTRVWSQKPTQWKQRTL